MPNAAVTDLQIHEVFASIQGESTYAGLPCVMVRTAGCNLRCTYCDTLYALGQGEKWSASDILAKVDSYGLKHVEITGGEPLLQAGTVPLMKILCDRGYTVLLETNGSLEVTAVDPRVIRIIDLKTPASGAADLNLWSNLESLRPSDEIKFVLADRRDYDWSVDVLFRHALPARCAVLMGPVFGRLAPARLAEWILADRLPVRLQIQLHKLIWDAEARGV
jgi:7-carboxy-7-deazaguanine synthase